MADGTGIEWTDATWNPVRGCRRVSEGCRHCYAEKLAARFSGPGQPFEGLAERVTRPNGTSEARWTGEVRVVESVLDQPLRWKRPRRIFVNSMSDLFHEAVPDCDIQLIFMRMREASHHTFQVLTKRPERMLAFCTARDPPPLPNVWLGVSVEDQAMADARIPLLLQTPATIRFVSAEPLLGPIDLDRIAALQHTPEDRGWAFDCLATGDTYRLFEEDGRYSDIGDGPHRDHRIDWVIAGGESGQGARPMHPDWARSLRDQCTAAGVPFFFKQWGEWREWHHGSPDIAVDADSDEAASILASARSPGWVTRDGKTFRRARDLPEGVPCRLMERVGKKAAGALLDGREHKEFPT